MDGERLFGIVEGYCGAGEHHRSGTPEDRATVDWLAQTLRDLGGEPEILPYTFDRYDATWSLTVDGEDTFAIPLFYEGTGHVVTDCPATTSMRIRGGTVLPDWDPFARSAQADGAAAALVAIDTPNGLLCAPNRLGGKMGSGLPTLCVAGALGPRLAEAEVKLEIDARVVASESWNVICRLGEGADEDRVLLTTPMSGWFACAGERGTGIAVCLAVAEALLAEGHPVAVLACNGHELLGAGVKTWLEGRDAIPWRGVFHFGASVASGESDGVNPPAERTRGLVLTGHVPDAWRPEVLDAFSPLGLPVRMPTDAEAADPGYRWIGESVAWAPFGKPLLSMAGGFPLHHAPEDIPRLATTPALLEASYDAALKAARVLATA